MEIEKFKTWLELNGQTFTTIQSRISNCRTVESYEGNLDEHYIKDYGASLTERLSYSAADERNNLPAKHKVPINGNIRNGSATLKQAVKLYMAFRGESKLDIKSDNPRTNPLVAEVDEDDIEYIESSTNFSYEKDLKTSMVSQIKELFPKYKLYGDNNEGVEYLIGSKRIDILLEKDDGSLLAIELKSGTANYKVFGQLSMYLGLLMDEFPEKEIKGCIVAGKIDDTLKSATKTTQLISLKTYKMRLELQDE